MYDSDDNDDCDDDESNEVDSSTASAEGGQEAGAPELSAATQQVTGSQSYDHGQAESLNAAHTLPTGSSSTQSSDKVKAVSLTDVTAVEEPHAAARLSELSLPSVQAVQAPASTSLVSRFRAQMTELSKHMSQKLLMSAPSLGLQRVKRFTKESKQQTTGTAEALPALALCLHEKLAQTQLELADIKEYRLAAEHRQQLAAAAANMAAFTEDRLQVLSHYCSHAAFLQAQ